MTDLDELERLAKAATPGEWQKTIGHPSGLAYGIHARADKNSGSVPVVVFRGLARPTQDGSHNAALIVAAVNALPGLIARIRNLQEALGPDGYDCGVCDLRIVAGDICATDIEMGTCHAACLEGAEVVDLDTGEPINGPISTFIWEALASTGANP